MNNYKIQDRIRYYFENTMSEGPLAVIKWLAIVSAASVLVLGLIILVFGISGSPETDAEPLGFVEGTWKSLMATLDPGTMGGDEGWDFRLVRFIATLIGIFLISILIGTISSGIDEKLEEMKKGRSKVLEKNHTLILGWSSKIFAIITEIIEANSNQKNPVIVILSDKDKVEAEDEIRDRVKDFKNTKIVVRSGNPLLSTSMDVVSVNQARSIIVLSPEYENADTHVIKIVLGLTNGKNRKPEKYHIVAEIKYEKNLEAAHLVGGDEAIFVLSADLISRIIAQTCRQSGLSVVYSELLQFEGDEIYFAEAPSLVGKTYRELLFAYEDSAIIGIFTKNENVIINPSPDTVFHSGDQVVAISEDDDTVIANGPKAARFNQQLFNHHQENKEFIEKTLILGWNEKASRIIGELDNYVGQGSEVKIVADVENLAREVEQLQNELKKQTLSCEIGDIANQATLVNLQTQHYNHIIVLSKTDIDVQESDAKTLICLLHLRNLSEKAGQDYSIVTEMLDLQNRDLGVVAKADDFVVGDNIISLLLSQLSENKELKKVFDILFEAEGSEIYLKPVSRYVKTGVEVDFYTVLASAIELNESAIGYRITSKSRNSEESYGIKLNPKKSESVVFKPEDYIIVLSED
jgi:voltage-gated potassium channel Kch